MAARSRERPATAAAAAPAALGLWKPTRPARVGLRPPPGGVFFVWFVYIFICFLVFYMLLFIYIFVCLFVFYCFCVFWVFWGLVVFWRVGGGSGVVPPWVAWFFIPGPARLERGLHRRATGLKGALVQEQQLRETLVLIDKTATRVFIWFLSLFLLRLVVLCFC